MVTPGVSFGFDLLAIRCQLPGIRGCTDLKASRLFSDINVFMFCFLQGLCARAVYFAEVPGALLKLAIGRKEAEFGAELHEFCT